jgi:ZIP family zinc transporter
MSLSKTILLGFIAGVTILIGLPIGRIKRPMPSARAFLNALAIGILLFLVWDVLVHAWDPINVALMSVHAGRGGLGTAVGYGVLFMLGLTVGLLGLTTYERWSQRIATRRPMSDDDDTVLEVEIGPRAWSAAKRLALLIAVGIGLHNFAEGLAIGQSAAKSEITLATLLVIGFGLHNATEGFGIVAPIAADAAPGDAPPSWPFLLLMGLIGGGPAVLGTIVGHGFTSDAVSIVFLTLAAGSIIYVVIQLIGVGIRMGRKEMLSAGLLVGLIAGFLTDAVVSAGGA